MRLGILLIAVALVMGFGVAKATSRSGGQGLAPTDETALIIKGHVGCLDKAGHALPSDKSCPTDNARYVFTSQDGKAYTFSPDDPLAAMFSDTRVRTQLLQVTAQQRQGNKLELVTVQSIKDGKLYDIYYYCEICNITLYAPGPCPCCRRELEFKEAPAAQP